MSRADSATDPARWERVQDILHEALGLPPEARAALLTERCSDDAELRAEVESLLEASQASDAYFGDLADRAGITLSPEDDGAIGEARGDPRPELIGTLCGQYEVLRWLGRGGMASVYLAERRGEGFTQRVALKIVLKPSSDPAVRRRANEERRILARLEHRNIARLIDGGVTPDGDLFYAMEYVEGVDVLGHCDRHRLGIPDRLRLFLEVCAPVQFAHERLIVHLDLKPNNIFVTADGHVKLLDFGVARLIDPDAAGDDVTGLWFTPAYASPEQVRREPLGTASDVYSLGVLLYELLTGHRPYRFPTRTAESVVQTVGQVTPPPPSAVVTQPSPRTRDGGEVAPEELAATRRSTPDRIRRRLRGDLDAIVMKALAKDPRERYTTAEQLAADIRRHLEHRPVSCVPSTPRYRLGKVVRRNRGAFAAAGMVLVALAAGLGATLWQATRATRAAALAREEAEKAELVASVMTDLFRLSDPNEALGDTITARDLLDQGARRIQTELGDQPEVQAQLLAEVAEIYRNLGLYRRAEPLARQALALREAEFGRESLEATESLILLGRVQGELGREGEAIETLDRAIAIRSGLVDFPDAELAGAQGSLAWLVRNAQRHERAAELFTAALEGHRALDPNSPALADMTFGLAATYHDSGMLDVADSLLRAGVQDLGPSSRPTLRAITALRSVGTIRRVREQYREAEPLLRTALDMAVRLYGPEHVEVYDTQAELGVTLSGTGAWDEAETILRAAIRGSSAQLGPDHPSTAGLQERLGTLLLSRGSHEEAVEMLVLGLEEKVRRHEFRDHPGVVSTLVAVAEALVGAGSHAEARAYVTRAEEMIARLPSEPSVYSISTERSLGLIAWAEGDPEVAERHLRRSVHLGEQLLSRPDHRYLIQSRTELGRFLAAHGRRDEGIGHLEWALGAQIANLGEPHPLVERTRRALQAAHAG